MSKFYTAEELLDLGLEAGTIVLPGDLWALPLTPSEFKVLLALIILNTWSDPQAYTTIPYLMELTHLSRPTVRRALSKLEGEGQKMPMKILQRKIPQRWKQQGFTFKLLDF